jgi:carbamoyl-phosphate synthase large subunit
MGVLRLLRLMERPVRIITADPDARAAGHWLGDRAHVIPMAGDGDFVSALERIVQHERIDVVLVGTDVELGVLARERARFAALGATVVVASPDFVDVADDKWRTVQALQQAGLPHPRSALATDRAGCLELADECGFPLFAKPRRGARSVGARLVRERHELDSVCAPDSDLIVQEHLPDDPGEYTAGCVGFGPWGDDGGGGAGGDGGAAAGGARPVGGVVVLRRDLRDGNTYRAYHGGTDLWEADIVRIATALGVQGPCNFQFRVRDGEPVVFEINARFSGTTPLRAMFGFNEVEAVVEHVLTGALPGPPNLRPGTVLRTWSDLFVDSHDIDQLHSAGSLDTPRGESLNFVTPRP